MPANYIHTHCRPEGMYFCRSDRGHMRDMLDNWKDDVSVIVVTDGSRILGLGDLGACGMGIPIGKLSLYVAAGGFNPSSCLPILIDTGTNNEIFLKDEFYLGCRHERLVDVEYFPMIDEFVNAVKDKWPSCLLQFEDFSTPHCFDLLEKYRHKTLCFNDDIQGTGAVIASGVLTALRALSLRHKGDTPFTVKDLKFVFFGAGSAGIGVADAICQVLMRRHKLTEEEAKGLFYMCDTKGLVTKTRGDKLPSYKVPYARKETPTECRGLVEVVKLVKPAILFGLSGQGGAFSDEVLKIMGEVNEHPIIFALSNPTSHSECTAEAAFKATGGRCIFASGSPFDDVVIDGKKHSVSQGNNMYIFPGLGLGSYLCGAKAVTDDMTSVAAESLSDLVTPARMNRGELYPGLSQIREISVRVAVNVMEEAWRLNIATVDRPLCDVQMFVRENMYVPTYLGLDIE
eukprot:GHVR01142313.1.p1 GENE.GHVR01142313.1~~GHVR01142313.1.p1  ORF type:complete len:457 (+),score=110.21 GHVR01142313.1:373-1743(+)